MAKYKCTKCGHVYSENPEMKNSKESSSETEKKPCCPNCGADQGEYCKFYEEEKAGRYD
jgi:rubredoxin